MVNQPMEEPVSREEGPESPARSDIARRVATGLREPVQVRAIGVGIPMPTKLSDHAIDRWHSRVMNDRSRFEATAALVELLESGQRVRTRRHPFAWVCGRDKNLSYFTIGSEIILPAEAGRDDGVDLEVLTCLTNPRAPRSCFVTSGRGARDYRRTWTRRRRNG